MTKVLFWNVNNFGTNGFFPKANARPRSVGDDGDYDVPAAPADAADRLRVLLGVINDVRPDIISVVEVQPGGGAPAAGDLVADKASVKLLAKIKQLTASGFVGADEFRLVPPLVSGVAGQAEGVAVYFRQDRLQFLGPYGWDGERGVEVGPETMLASYPADRRTLPARQIPEGLINEGRSESRLAGQYVFTDGMGEVMEFPDAGSRSPWLTMFSEIETGRVIKLLSHHAPPQLNRAIEAVQKLAQIPIMTGEIAANEVRCIVGDFNVSSLNEQARLEAFLPLVEGANYALQFNPALAGVEEVLPEGGFYITVLQPSADATPWFSDREGTEVFGYPAFCYLGAGAIDNALTRHGAGAGAAAAPTICNPVMTSPYNRSPIPQPEVPENVLRGTYAVNTYLAEPGVMHYDAENYTGIDGDEEEADTYTEEFREWHNYTHIRSCSDHLPIALEI
jgi:hypothetical protein